MTYAIAKVTTEEEIFSTLCQFDDYFQPPLSRRISSSTTEYAHKLYCSGEVYAAKDKGVIGFVTFYCNDHDSQTAYLAIMAVAREYQNQHLGRALLETCIQVCRDSGMQKIKLQVRTYTPDAIRFYERNGFKYLAAASDTSFCMVKDIGSSR